MNKAKMRRIELEGDDFERIGGFYYCLYCGSRVREYSNYHDGGFEGTSRECDCVGANEAIEIRDQQRILNKRLISLKANPGVQEILNRLKFKAAVKEAAIRFNQPQSD